MAEENNTTDADARYARLMGILPKIAEKLPTPYDSDKSRLLVKQSAGSIVYNSSRKFKNGESLTPAAEEAIKKHLANLDASDHSHDKDALSYFYAVSRVLLPQEEKESPRLIQQAFAGRTVCFGEDHTESDLFINDLIRTFCEEKKGHTYRPPEDRGDRSHMIINDLIEFCLEEERYTEADSLIWECLSTVGDLNATSADSVRLDFPTLSSEWEKWNTAQMKLAELQTPDSDFYWEDSRMYLCRWESVSLVPAFPADPFPPTSGTDKCPPLNLSELRYSIEEIGKRDIRMTVPFVPYDCFQKMRAWSYGFTYVEYLEVLRCGFIGKYNYLSDARERVCAETNRKERMPLWYLPRQSRVNLSSFLLFLLSFSFSIFFSK